MIAEVIIVFILIKKTSYDEDCAPYLLSSPLLKYLKTIIQILRYVIIAFALFAAYLTNEYLDEVYEEQVDTPYNDVVFGLVTFGVTVFFFLAIVRQRRRKIQLGD